MDRPTDEQIADLIEKLASEIDRNDAARGQMQGALSYQAHATARLLKGWEVNGMPMRMFP